MTDLLKEDIGYLVLISKEINGKKIEHKGYVVDVSKDVIKLKLLDNGYNIDVSVDGNTIIQKFPEKINLGSIPIIKLKENKDLPSITYIGT
ncbi:MAG: hypothetical protein WCF78_02235, partial [archaeon]